MPLTREDLRASFERAGEPNWRMLVAYHEDAYPASRPTPGDISRGEAERLNGEGYGDANRYVLLESTVQRTDRGVRLVHTFRDIASGAQVVTPPYTDYE